MTTKLAPFDSTLSMKAMCAQQAIEALRKELDKLTPQQCIDIEMEMATRLHADVGGVRLAKPKFAKMVADINAIMPWFETFIELLRTDKGKAA